MCHYILALPVVLCLRIIGFEPCGTCKAQRQRRRQELQQQPQKSLAVTRPDRLPKNRRALSISSPRDALLRSTIVSSRSASRPCRLLELPSEIRQQIFTEVVGGKVVHLVRLMKGLGHYKCLRTHPNNFGHDFERHCTNWRGEQPQLSGGNLALLRTCRQFYRESCHLLYSTNVFDVDHPQTLAFLERTIRTDRLASIRSLQLFWRVAYVPTNAAIEDLEVREPDAYTSAHDFKQWLWACKIVTEQMAGLQVLKVKIAVASQFLRYKSPQLTLKEISERILRPLEVMQERLNLEVHFSPWDMTTGQQRAPLMLEPQS